MSEDFVVWNEFLIGEFRSRKEEIQALSGPNEFPEFYSRLKNLRQFYPKNPAEEVYSNDDIRH